MEGKEFLSPEAGNAFLWTVVGSPLALLSVWLLAANLLAFALFGLDKWKAKRKARNPRVMRIRERTLFLSALLGGSVGAILGMRVFRHKTRRKSFTVGLPLILAVQVLIPLCLWYFSR